MTGAVSEVVILVPFGRIGWCSYRVDLDDGRYVYSGAWFSESETIPYLPEEWIYFSEGADEDPELVAAVAATALDPLVTAAIAEALA